MTPGSNLLAEALTVIEPQLVRHYRFVRQAPDAAGVMVTQYAPARDVWGSFQPVSTALMAQLGLEMNKRHALLYSSQPFTEPGRDTAGDQFAFNGRRWSVLDNTDWAAVDGWNVVLLAEIGPDA